MLRCSRSVVCAQAAWFQDLYAVDHSSNRHSPKVKPVVIDVSNSQQLQIIKSILLFCKPCYVHFGLPCGTCSRAREQRLPSYSQGIKAPQPLRNEHHLQGVPSLSGSDLLKVQTDNALYRAAITLLEVCRQLNCCITIENPHRSWLWMLLAHYIKQNGNRALIAWYSNLECVHLMLAPMQVTGTNEPSFLPRQARFQIQNNIALKITSMRHGPLIGSTTDWFSQPPLKPNTHRFFVFAWQLVCNNLRAPAKLTYQWLPS